MLATTPYLGSGHDARVWNVQAAARTVELECEAAVLDVNDRRRASALLAADDDDEEGHAAMVPRGQDPAQVFRVSGVDLVIGGAGTTAGVDPAPRANLRLALYPFGRPRRARPLRGRLLTVKSGRALTQLSQGATLDERGPM